MSRSLVDGAVDVADVAMARYHDPHRLDELLHAIRDGIQEKTISSWERRVFETRMTFVRTNGRKPSMEVLTALVKGRPGTEKEIDAVKHTYYTRGGKTKGASNKTETLAMNNDQNLIAAHGEEDAVMDIDLDEMEAFDRFITWCADRDCGALPQSRGA